MSGTLKAGVISAVLGGCLVFVTEMFVSCALVQWPLLFGTGMLAGLLAGLWQREEPSLGALADCFPACVLPALACYLACVLGGLAHLALFPSVMEEFRKALEKILENEAFRDLPSVFMETKYLYLFSLTGNACCCGLVDVGILMAGLPFGAWIGLMISGSSPAPPRGPQPPSSLPDPPASASAPPPPPLYPSALA